MHILPETKQEDGIIGLVYYGSLCIRHHIRYNGRVSFNGVIVTVWTLRFDQHANVSILRYYVGTLIIDQSISARKMKAFFVIKKNGQIPL